MGNPRCSPRLRNGMRGGGRGLHRRGVGCDGLIRVGPLARARLRCALPGCDEIREERGGGPDGRNSFGSRCRSNRDEGSSPRLERRGPAFLPTELPL